MKNLARRAQLIFTSSQSEAARIARHVPSISPLAVGLGLARDYALAEPVAPSVIPARFILTVGRLNVRKNLSRLIEATVSTGLVSPEMPLVIVGSSDGRSGSDPTAANDAVIWMGAVSDGTLKWLYRHASAFVFPSLDEGFGLPVLEAAAEGTPLVLSDIPAFREFNLPAEYFDPRDVSSIAAAIQRALGAGVSSTRPAGRWSETVTAMRNAILKEIR